MRRTLILELQEQSGGNRFKNNARAKLCKRFFEGMGRCGKDVAEGVGFEQKL